MDENRHRANAVVQVIYRRKVMSLAATATMVLMLLLLAGFWIMGALLAQWGRGLINDVYCQIGLVMLIGLALLAGEQLAGYFLAGDA